MSLMKKIRNKIYLWLNQPRFLRCGGDAAIDCSCEIGHQKYISIGKRVSVGEGSWINCPVENLGSRKIRPPMIIIEDDVEIGRRAIISGVEHIHLHKNVLLSPNVYISDHRHQYEDTEIPVRKQPVSKIKPIEIGENTWIGINSCLLPGASLGKNCVVGANSVVNRSFPDNSVLAGSPAKIIKKLN